MGGFTNNNVSEIKFKGDNFEVANKSVSKSSSYVSSNSVDISSNDVETVDLDDENSKDTKSSDSKRWKSYEDACADGHSDVLTRDEFYRRKSNGSSSYDGYKSYEDYLKSMYEKYQNNNTEQPSSNINDESFDEMEDILKDMSKEDYDEFIKEMTDNYNTDISQYESMLSELQKILERLDDGKYVVLEKCEMTNADKQAILERMYWFVREGKYEGTGYTREQLVNMSDEERIEFIVKYDEEAKKLKDAWDKAKKENADSVIKEGLSDLGITTLDEYIEYRASVKSSIDSLEEAIKTTKNMRDSAYYDYLKYTKAYGDYKEYKPTEKDKNDITSSGTVYDYSEYKKTHSNVTPLEYMKMIKDKGVDLSFVSFIGIGNADELKTIASISDKYPDMAKTYNYLYDKDPSKLEDYFNKSKYEINNLEGQVRAEKFLSSLGTADGDNDALEGIANELGVTVEGLQDGLTQFGEGVYYSFEAFMTAIGAWDENRTMSAEEYKRMYIMYGLLSKDDKAKMNLITKDENGNYVNSDPNSIIDYSREYSGPGLSGVYEISQGIGNMVPSMAISAAITYACPAAGLCSAAAAASAGATVGAVTSGISAGGNAYHNSMVNGSSFKSSVIYGIYSGTSSAITQRVLGSIPFLSNVKVSSIATYLKAMGQQATQATVQGVLDGLAQAAILGNYPKNEQELQEFIKGLVKNAAYGAITSGILNLPALGTSIYGKLKFNKTMKNYGFTNDEIKNSIDEFRNTHPEYSKMTDNELKQLFGTSLFDSMTKSKISKIMKGLNDDTVKIRSLDDPTLKLLAMYSSDEEFDIVLKKLNLLNMSEEKLYNYKKEANPNSAMSIICDRVNKSHYIKRNLEGTWVEVSPGDWRQIDSKSSSELIKLAKKQLSDNYDVLKSRLNALKQQYGDDIDVDMYWRVANEKKTDRPDPSTYIKKDSKLYKAWQADFSDGDAYCVYSTSAYNRFVRGYGNVGAGDGQFVFGKSTYKKIEKVMNDSTLTEAQKRVKYTEILGFDDPNYFKDGIVMIKRSTLDSDGNMIAQPSTGRESTANNMYSPYLHTSGGSIEAVLPQVPNVRESTITDPNTGKTYTGYVDKNTGKVVDGIEIVHSDMP